MTAPRSVGPHRSGEPARAGVALALDRIPIDRDLDGLSVANPPALMVIDLPRDRVSSSTAIASADPITRR